jgi:exosortase A-associated hydrolase 2
MAEALELDASYRDFGTGLRFCIDWAPPGGQARGAVLLLPAFGEEMNKCRRAVAVAARHFARAGMMVRSVDAYGSGDSPGEFGSATWATWLDDYRAAAADLVRTKDVPLTLWAVRAGSLLAAELAVAASGVLLWQPVLSGDQHLTQILRLQVANDAFAGKGTATTTRDLRARLEAGETLEVAGYELNPELVLPLARASLGAWAHCPGPVQWLETGTEALAEPPPGSARAIAALASKGVAVEYAHVTGEPFWMTLEVTENPAIIERSLDWLSPVLT